MEGLIGEFTNVKCIVLYDVAMGESFHVVKSGFKNLYILINEDASGRIDSYIKTKDQLVKRFPDIDLTLLD